MNRWLLRTGAFLFWTATIAWLIRYEAFPERFTHSMQGYSSLLSRDVLVDDSWMKIRYGDTDVGYTHTSMDTGRRGDEEFYLISTRTQIDVTIMGKPRGIYASGTAALDTTRKLQDFSFSLSSGDVRASARGKRLSGDTFDVTLDMGGEPQRMRVAIPDDVIVQSPATLLSLKRLRPGQDMTLSALDPLTLKKTAVRVQAIRTEDIVLAGESHRATLLLAAYQGMTLRTWIDADGNVLRQESPLGWVVEKCSRDEALALSNKSGQGVELLNILTARLLSTETENDRDTRSE